MTKAYNTSTSTTAVAAATKDADILIAAIIPTVTSVTDDYKCDHGNMILKEEVRKEEGKCDSNNNNKNNSQARSDDTVKKSIHHVTLTHSSNISSSSSSSSNLINEKEMQMKIEMKEISSIGFFKATPLSNFRRKWKKILKHNILLLTTSTTKSKSTTIIRYDRFEIKRILSNNIDWKSLCENHDKDKQRRRRQQQEEGKRSNSSSNSDVTTCTSTTALGEIVTAMINPTIIPHCCRVKCLMEVLLNAILVSPSPSSSSINIVVRQQQQQQQNTTTRWTPSQQFLLETIRELLWGSSSSSSSSFIMIDCIQDFVVSITKLPTTTLSTSASSSASSSTANKTATNSSTTITPNKINRLLSSIYWLLSSSSSSLPLLEMKSLVSSGLLLLQRIDQKSIPSSQGRTDDDDDDDDSSSRRYCPVCTGSGNGNGRVRNTKMRVADLSDLHDEELTSENSNIARYNSNSNNKMQYFWRRGHEVKNVSLKDVLSMKGKRKSNSNNNTEQECQCTTTTTSNSNSNRDRENLKRKRATDSTTKISTDWSKVRSRAYKKFVSFVVEQQQQTRQQKRLRELSPNNNLITSTSTTEMKAKTTTRMEYELNLNSDDDETWMWWLLRDTAFHPESPTRRVCLALLAHSLGGPKCPYYYQKIAKLCWRGYLETLPPESTSSSISLSPESSCGWLRLYSEWLSECSIFDQREQAWEAFQPILQHVVATATNTASDPHNEDTEVYSQTHDDDDANQIGSNEINPSLLACLGYILHRRSHLFEHCRTDDETNNNNKPKASIGMKFRSFLDILSIHCGESSEPWLRLFSDSDSIRDGVESTLQQLGVLSFSMLDSRKKSNRSSTMSNFSIYQARTDTKSDKYLYFLATSNWPYASQFYMRNAMSRIDRSVMSLENGNDAVVSLLTSPTSGYKTTKKSKKNKRTDKSLSYVPMMDYLYDNGILCLIFSFCGPKRLSKIPQVCKVWKAIVDTVSNTLWQKSYVTQFGAYQWPCSISENHYLVATTITTANDDINHNIESISKTFWKDHFDRKQIIERIVQFQRNPRTGYKHRTCCYLDCLEIFKTANQEHKHYQMHLRRLTKQRATLLAKKTKKKKAKGKKVIATKER